jgi:hypothetical protein
MTYTIKIPSWTEGAFSNAWDAMVDSNNFYDNCNASEYFKDAYKIDILCEDASDNYSTAVFPSKDSYVLFLLEWS